MNTLSSEFPGEQDGQEIAARQKGSKVDRRKVMSDHEIS